MTFCRRHFQTLFLEWQSLCCDSNFTEVCSKESHWQSANIGSGIGLGLNRREAIAWTDGDPINWRLYASPGFNAFSSLECLVLVLLWSTGLTRLDDRFHMGKSLSLFCVIAPIKRCVLLRTADDMRVCHFAMNDGGHAMRSRGFCILITIPPHGD